MRRAHPEATEFWEANWLKVDVAVRAGAFRGAFEADLRADELQGFAEQLEALEGDAQGAAALRSMEGWVSIRLTAGPRGRVQAACEVRDDPAGGTSLRFDLGSDLAQVAALRGTLAELLRAFPVLGEAEEGEVGLLLPPGDEGQEPEQH